MEASSSTTQSSDLKKLCDLLLQVAGRDATRYQAVFRHASVLTEALPFMDKEQTDIAERRLCRYLVRWGGMLPSPPQTRKFSGIEPELRIIDWLSRRRNPKGLLHVLFEAARLIQSGESHLLDVRDYAFSNAKDHYLLPIGYDSFREWMIQLRIGQPEPNGRVSPGLLCDWWVQNMRPNDPVGPSYAACLEFLRKMDAKRLSQ